MNKNIALFIAGVVLLLVALTMGEDGTVSKIADRDGAEAVQIAQTRATPSSVARPTSQLSSNWNAATPVGQPPAVEIYHHNERHVPPPPIVVDRKIAAASEIQ